MQYYVYGPWAIFLNCSRVVGIILPRTKGPFHLNNLQMHFWYTPLLPKGHFRPLWTGLKGFSAALYAPHIGPYLVMLRFTPTSINTYSSIFVVQVVQQFIILWTTHAWYVKTQPRKASFVNMHFYQHCDWQPTGGHCEVHLLLDIFMFYHNYDP